MGDIFKDLYPSHAWNFPVSSLPVPRPPKAPAARANTGSVKDFYGAALLKTFLPPEGDQLALIDKAFPHSRFDVMMLASDEQVKSAIVDLRPATKLALFELAAKFADYVSEPATIERFRLEDGSLHVSFNFSRDTVDRESSMFFEKRFHLHLNYTPGHDFSFGPSVRWSDLSTVSLQRRYLDPATFVGAAVLADRLRSSSASKYIVAHTGNSELLSLPAGLLLRLPNWAFLGSREFVALLDELHTEAQSVYDTLRELATRPEQAESGPWTRPRLRSKSAIFSSLEQLSWLQAGTRESLKLLLGSLRDITPPMGGRFQRSEHDRVRCLALNGLDYSVGIFARQLNSRTKPLNRADPIYLNFQPRLFGDIGGAGLPPIYPHPMVRLDRAAGPVLSGADLDERRLFREQFLLKFSHGLSSKSQ